MKIHKEGYKFLRYGILILISLAFFSYTSVDNIIDVVFFIYFFRIPDRKFEKRDNVVYAPCDGKVVVIEETTETEFYNDERMQISIFMSPLNVHNNLYPIGGEIIYTKYHPGKFLFAWNPKASTDNERNTIVVSNKKISILCRQIAGALARRIVSYSKIKDKVYVADEIGFIKFGSRVDLFLPKGTKIKTTIGKKVIGGQSIIALY